MKMKKFAVLLLLAAAVSTLSAAEVFRAKSRGDWDGRPEVDAEGIFTAKLPRRLISMKQIKIDPSKTYTLSGEFRVEGCDRLQPFFFGFVPKTENNLRIDAKNLRQYDRTSLGKVAADAPAAAGPRHRKTGPLQCRIQRQRSLKCKFLVFGGQRDTAS